MRRAITILTAAGVVAGAAALSTAQPGRRGFDGPERGQGRGMLMDGGPRGEKGERQAPQLEGPGADVATACIEAMGATRRAALDAVRTAAQGGVQTIRTLDENEAPDDAIVVAAKQAGDTIAAAAIDADTTIARAALEYVEALQGAGAERRTVLAVILARDGNQRAVHLGARRGGHAVRFAAGVATGQIDPDAAQERGEGRGPRGRGGFGPGGPHGGPDCAPGRPGRPGAPEDDDGGGADPLDM